MKWAGSSFDSSSVIRHFLGWVCLARLSRVWCPLRGLFGCGVSGASFSGATTAPPPSSSPVFLGRGPSSSPVLRRLSFRGLYLLGLVSRPSLAVSPRALPPRPVLLGLIEAMILANGHMRRRNMPLRCVRPVTHGATMMMRRRLSWGGLTPLSTTDGYRRRCRR